MGRIGPVGAGMAGQGGYEYLIYVHFAAELERVGQARLGRGAGLWYLLAL
jgi:hypothetical protein